MKSIPLDSELRKVGCSERLAIADFLVFDDFLMFLDLAEISVTLPPPPLSTSSFSTPTAVRIEFSDDPVDKLVYLIVLNSIT